MIIGIYTWKTFFQITRIGYLQFLSYLNHCAVIFTLFYFSNLWLSSCIFFYHFLFLSVTDRVEKKLCPCTQLESMSIAFDYSFGSSIWSDYKFSTNLISMYFPFSFSDFLLRGFESSNVYSNSAFVLRCQSNGLSIKMW